jgi:RNA 3'-phosphate cyclase
LIEIDGSLGEGGGSVIRISTALAALTSQSIRITNIRANRPKKGLAAQHLNAIKAVAHISNASIDGLKLGSEKIIFTPGNLKGGSFSLDIKTAGSTTLVLQAFMIPAAFAPSSIQIELKGGTDVRWSPSVDYLQNVTLPTLEKMGYKIKLELIKRGHFPRGRGILKATIKPLKKLNPVEILKSEIEGISGISHALNLPRHVAERQAAAAEKILKSEGYNIDIKIEHSDNEAGSGSGIVLWTSGNTPLGGSSIGERGKSAEEVGAEAAQELIYSLQSNAPLDKYMADQIIPYMALAGDSAVKIAELTSHTLTNIKLVEKITAKKFHIDGVLGESAIIRTGK